jgi:hypothetical protein
MTKRHLRVCSVWGKLFNASSSFITNALADHRVFVGVGGLFFDHFNHFAMIKLCAFVVLVYPDFQEGPAEVVAEARHVMISIRHQQMISCNAQRRVNLRRRFVSGIDVPPLFSLLLVRC